MFKLLSIAIISVILTRCDGYPRGLEGDFCSYADRRPMHRLHMPQNTLPPYKMDVTSTTYRPNEPINITLRGLNPTIKFKGFFISSSTSTQLFRGPVQNLTTNIQGVGNCGMSHTDNKPKSSVTISWLPPPGIHVGAVQFRAVVVASFSTFWDRLSTDTILPDLNFEKGGYKTFKQITLEREREANLQLSILRNRAAEAKIKPLEGNTRDQTKSVLTSAIAAGRSKHASLNTKAVK